MDMLFTDSTDLKCQSVRCDFRYPDADDDAPAISDEDALAFLKPTAPQRDKRVIVALVVGVLVVGALVLTRIPMTQRDQQRNEHVPEPYRQH